MEVIMPHSKLIAGEVAGTYLVTSSITETDIIAMAKRFARRKISQPHKHLQLLLQYYKREVFSALFRRS
ncbi:hypothetical protein DK37_30490 [Halomonas sp. SUBG004]|nr:hypothetical protein DK37_30490 [Halomonas sp. SUBG004]